MVLLENTGDCCFRGVSGDGKNSIAELVYEECGFGDGVLHLVDSGDRLRVTVNSFLDLDRESVRGRTMWARRGRKRR